MAKAPTVQTLDQIMAELQPGYAGQKGIINKQIANTDATYKANELALDAAKTQGFNQINTQATGKGASFSGVPQDEQLNYLATTYLPGVQKAKAQKQADTLTLQGQLAAIDTDIRNKAFGSRETQQSALNQWNLQMEQNRFTAEQNERDRQARAAEAAANRAATAAAQPKGMSGSQLNAWAANYVKGKQGSDKKISPSAYYAGFSDFYTQTGLGQDEYMAIMSKYVNTSHAQDYKLF